MRVCSLRNALNSFNPFVMLRLQNAQNLSLSFHSLFSLAVSSNTNDTNNSKRSSSSRAPLLLLSLSLLYILVMNTKILLINGEILFSSKSLSTRPVCTNKRIRRSLLFSVQQTKKLTLRSTETAPFCTKKSKTRVPSYRLKP